MNAIVFCNSHGHDNGHDNGNGNGHVHGNGNGHVHGNGNGQERYGHVQERLQNHGNGNVRKTKDQLYRELYFKTKTYIF